jgi:hypothetical protein
LKGGKWDNILLPSHHLKKHVLISDLISMLIGWSLVKQLESITKLLKEFPGQLSSVLIFFLSPTERLEKVISDNKK